MATEDEISESIQGQFAGAVKRWDSNDVLDDEQVDAYAGKAAEMFAATLISRCSQYQQDELMED